MSTFLNDFGHHVPHESADAFILLKCLLSRSSVSRFARVSYLVRSFYGSRALLFMCFVGVRPPWTRNALKLAHAKLRWSPKIPRLPISILGECLSVLQATDLNNTNIICPANTGTSSIDPSLQYIYISPSTADRQRLHRPRSDNTLH